MYKDKNIIAINFSDENFEKTRKICSETLISKGKVDKVIEYSPSMIDEDFRANNKEILSRKRGAGLWLWKPYFILKTLKEMKDGDYLFYTDAGVVVLKPISKLIPDLEASGQEIMSYELPLLEREWSKQETIKTILGDVECNDNQILATYMLLKNTAFTRNFVEAWLTFMQNPVCTVPETLTDIPNHPDYAEHREDQSVFSLLCRKHLIVPFKEPSQHGERPYNYAWGKFRVNKLKRYSYAEKKHPNSHYRKIVLSVRSEDPVKALRKEKIITFLNRIGIYNRFTCQLKRKSFLKKLR